MSYKLRQVLQIRAIITNWGIKEVNLEQQNIMETIIKKWKQRKITDSSKKKKN